MNLYNLGLSGLSAAQAGLAVTSHNIDNAAVQGYSRQKLMLSTAGATATGVGFFGRGVEVDTVERYHNSFIHHQLVEAQGYASQLSTHYEQLSAVNNLFGDETVGISPALSGFFDAVNAAASAPADLVPRQDLLNKAQRLTIQIQQTYNTLDNQRRELNNEIAGTVEQINNYLQNISDLNQKIIIARGTASEQPPNDLLDQRDQALAQLNRLVGVNFYEQGDRINLTLIGGQTLLSGTKVYNLSAVESAADPTRTAVAYSMPGVVRPVELDDTEVTGGELSGLLAFRAKSLDQVQDRLGQLAVEIALSFNRQHTQGMDLNRVNGGDFFDVTAPAAIPNARNTGTAVLGSTFTDFHLIQASPYKIEFDGVNYVVTRLSDNRQFPPGALPLAFDGVSVDRVGVGAPNPGDSWLLQPTRDAARDFAPHLTDPAAIALSDQVAFGPSNGNNGLLLAKVQTDLVFNNQSLNGQVAQLVNFVGVQTQQAKISTLAQEKLVAQSRTAMQAESGVNLNEEYVNLTVYQEQYLASAKIIEVASIIFDRLLNLRA